MFVKLLLQKNLLRFLKFCPLAILLSFALWLLQKSLVPSCLNRNFNIVSLVFSSLYNCKGLCFFLKNFKGNYLCPFPVPPGLKILQGRKNFPFSRALLSRFWHLGASSIFESIWPNNHLKKG